MNHRLLIGVGISLGLHVLILDLAGYNFTQPPEVKTQSSNRVKVQLHNRMAISASSTASSNISSFTKYSEIPAPTDSPRKSDQPSLPLVTPPKIRIGPNLIIALEGENLSCNILVEVNERGRVTQVTILNHNELPASVLSQISTAFRDEAIFIPSTVDGVPVTGTVVLEVNLSDH